MDWTDISITCVCIKHSFSLPSNEFTVKCVGRVTVAEKNLCDVKCTFLSKKLSLPPGKLVFSPLFSQLHTFLSWFQVVYFGGFLFWVFQHLSQKRTNECCKCFGSQFSEKYLKKPCIGYFQTCYIFFSSSASMLCILSSIFEVLGKWFLHQSWPSLFYFVLLTTWSAICTSKLFIWDKKDLEAGCLSTRQQNNQMSLFIFLIPPPASLFQRHSKNNLYIEWTEVFLLQKSSLFHMDCRKGFLDICPVATFWPVGKQATDSVFVWLLILQSSGTALFATCIHNFFSNQFFKTLI